MAEDRMERIYQEDRPWGSFRQFTHNAVSTVKILFVTPGHRLSEQKHFHRDELWRVLTKGINIILKHPDGRVERLMNLKPGDEVFIPRGVWHRLCCNKRVRAAGQVLEISFGEFDEKDEERGEDDYGRS